jgi:hypothetical protein
VAGGGTFERRLGDTDCEAFRGGLLSQPVNSLSSLAFLAVAVAVVRWALLQPAGRRLLPIVFAATVAANGVGGLLFHGPAWPGSAWVHDVAIVAPLLFIVLFDVSSLRPLSDVQFLGAGGVVLALIGMILAGVPQAANAVSAVFAALALGTELVSAGPRYAFRRSRQAYAILIAALVIGAAANVLGRTGGPLCAEESPAQGHALWHVGIAVALGAWAVAAFTAWNRRPAIRRDGTTALPA